MLPVEAGRVAAVGWGVEGGEAVTWGTAVAGVCVRGGGDGGGSEVGSGRDCEVVAVCVVAAAELAVPAADAGSVIDAAEGGGPAASTGRTR